ncbi:MAG: ComF family protein [Minisyncoccia bacterium]
MPHRFFNFLLDLLFPWQCLYCHQEVNNDYPLCNNCFNQIPILDDFICPVCQKRLAYPDLKHSSCIKQSALSALGVVSFYHHPILKETLHYFKYKQIQSLQIPLSLLMIKFLENSFYFSRLNKKQLIIIPLPLHFKKQKQRGFNQSALLAEQIAKYFHLPLETNILIRIINNPPQITMEDAQARQLNIQGIFKVKNQEHLLKKTVLLIDDVYTTGATLNEAAKTLKQAGAKKVIGLVLAKG